MLNADIFCQHEDLREPILFLLYLTKCKEIKRKIKIIKIMENHQNYKKIPLLLRLFFIFDQHTHSHGG